MTNQKDIQERIQFLKEQMESLEHYLPETYQYLMAELDRQHRDLMALKIQHFYDTQNDEQQDPNPTTGNSEETEIPHHRTKGIRE